MFAAGLAALIVLHVRPAQPPGPAAALSSAAGGSAAAAAPLIDKAQPVEPVQHPLRGDSLGFVRAGGFRLAVDEKGSDGLVGFKPGQGFVVPASGGSCDFCGHDAVGSHPAPEDLRGNSGRIKGLEGKYLGKCGDLFVYELRNNTGKPLKTTIGSRGQLWDIDLPVGGAMEVKVDHEW